MSGEVGRSVFETEDQDQRQAWLAERASGIGGSEVAAVLGLNKYATPYDVWLRKTNREQEKGDDAFTERGRILEPAVVEFFAQKTGYQVTNPIPTDDPRLVLRHPEYPYMLGTPDRFYLDDLRREGVLEAKTTLMKVDRDSIPLSWFFQGQWYCGITGRQRVAICWLGANLGFEFAEYDFNPGIFADMVDQVKHFWEYNVLGDVRPAAIRRDDILRMYEKTVPEAMEATPETYQIYEQLLDARQRKKQAEEDEDSLKEQLQLAMLDKEEIRLAGSLLVSWRWQGNSKVDAKRLKELYPEAYATCLREGKQRTFLPRDKG